VLSALRNKLAIDQKKVDILLRSAGIDSLNHFRYHTKNGSHPPPDRSHIREFRSPPPPLFPCPTQGTLSLSLSESSTLRSGQSRVCDDKMAALISISLHITDFFTSAVPYTSTGFPAKSKNRHFKPHLKASDLIEEKGGRAAPILLSNQFPILRINSSLIDQPN